MRPDFRSVEKPSSTGSQRCHWKESSAALSPLGRTSSWVRRLPKRSARTRDAVTVAPGKVVGVPLLTELPKPQLQAEPAAGQLCHSASARVESTAPRRKRVDTWVGSSEAQL